MMQKPLFARTSMTKFARNTAAGEASPAAPNDPTRKEPSRMKKLFCIIAASIAIAAAATGANASSHAPSPVAICLNGHTQQLPAQAAAVVLAHNPNAHAGACQPAGGGGGGGGTDPGTGGTGGGTGGTGDGTGGGTGDGTGTGGDGTGGDGTVAAIASAAASGGTNGVYRCNVWNGLYIVQSDKVAEDAAAGNRYADVILGKPFTGAPNTNPLQGSTVGHVACTSEGGKLIPGVVSDATGYLYDPKLTGVGYGIGSLAYWGT